MESTVTMTVEEYNALKDSADQNKWIKKYQGFNTKFVITAVLLEEICKLKGVKLYKKAI